MRIGCYVWMELFVVLIEVSKVLLNVYHKAFQTSTAQRILYFDG